MEEAKVAASPSGGNDGHEDNGTPQPQVPEDLARPDDPPRRTLRLPRHRRAHAAALASALGSTWTSTLASTPASAMPEVSPEVLRSRAERDRSRRRSREVSNAVQLLKRSRRETSRASDLLSEAKSAAARSGVVIPDDPIACDRFAVMGGPNPTVAGGATVAATGYGVEEDAAGGGTRPVVLETSGGYSNTDHIVQVTGDPRADWIAEMKRALRRRARAARPEHRGEERWDIRQRIPGGRRRRIVRSIDLPRAPPEPPGSGFVIFVGQMTAKVRHDRPRNAPHDQTKLVRGLGRLWRVGLSKENREYYLQFAKDAKAEYAEQVREFRATDSYRPSERFGKLLGLNHGPWVKLVWEEKNELEKELATYKTIVRPLSRMTVAEAALEQQKQRAEGGSGGDEEVALDFKPGRARVER